MKFFSKPTLLLIITSFVLSESAFARKHKFVEEDTPTMIRKMTRKIEKEREKAQKQKDKVEAKRNKRKKGVKRNSVLEKAQKKGVKKPPVALPKVFEFKVGELDARSRKYAGYIFKANRGKVKLTLKELEDSFRKIEELKNKIPGMTAKIVDFVKQGGYGKKKGKVNIKSSHLSKDPDIDLIIELLSIKYPKLKKKEILGTCSQKEMTEEIEAFLKYELDFQGMVETLAPWFKARFGIRWENSHFVFPGR